MKIDLIPTIAIVVSVAGLFLGALTFITNSMRERLRDLERRMIGCEEARDNLARENIALLKQLVTGQQNAASELVSSNQLIAKKLVIAQTKK